MQIGIIGLGYVGLPLAVAFSEYFDVYGFDTNKDRILEILNGNDHNNEISDKTLKKSLNTKLKITDDASYLKKCNIYIVTVPTPVDENFKPDLSLLCKASEEVGKLLKIGDIVVYESTVYPGTTEEVCIPILESYSKLKCGSEFDVGYSPERISPGDKKNTLKTVKKIISANSQSALEKIQTVYESIIDAGTYSAENIATAEMSKVVENAQRDINIAFMNEVSKICNSMGLNTQKVLEVAKTKWNFIDFHPGLVGGHCIGVDPYYLIHRAKSLKIKTDLLSISRSINESMVAYVENKIWEVICRKNKNLKTLKVLILGLTFKPNVPDFRNSKSIEIVRAMLKKNQFESIDLVDPYYAQLDTLNDFTVLEFPQFENYDVCVILTPHNVFNQDERYSKYVHSEECYIVDLYGAFNSKTLFLL
ncbi:nucleotide sugar dehydrogenase [Amylibacter sp.]|nr:nucleotide sugar dehydrogenase [Amylibacter sp.]MDC3304287.1 nucleotide sugar dehydrogenase [Amylibacter sp.]